MRITIIAMALSFPGEKGPERFYYIAKYLRSHGFDVLLLTSTYQHWEKRQRNISEIESEVKYDLAFQPEYKSNLSIKRIFSLKVFADNILKKIKRVSSDVIYCSIPDNYLAAKVMKYCNDNHIKGILDTEDLWPEAMMMTLKKKHLEKLFGWILKPYSHYARIAYDNANAYVGTSEEYTIRGNKYSVINRAKPKKTVYVGNDIDKFDQITYDKKNMIDKKNDFWVIYAGTIGASYDIKTAIDASVLLTEKGYSNIRFLILGDGQTKNELETYSKSVSCNVTFLGYQPYDVMTAYLKESDVTLNSFVKGAPQSIVTKIGDYLAAGIPMINTLENQEFMDMVNKFKFGINVEPENPLQLSNAIIDLISNTNKSMKYGKNARLLAEEKFNRRKSYHEIIELIEEVR